MTHLDTSNISYGQKKGQESNWQFNSRPLKVGNRLLAFSGVPHLESSQQELKIIFKPHLNRSFAHKVMGPQSRESPNFENFRTPTWES